MAFLLKFLPPALLLTLLLCHTRASAQQFVTNSPDTTEYKHWEIDLFSTYSHSAGSDSVQFPALELDYGLLPDVQLHAITPLLFDRQPGSGTQFGYGDTELGVKYRFLHETDTLPEISFFPMVELPTGESSRGLGNGQMQVVICGLFIPRAAISEGPNRLSSYLGYQLTF